MPTDSLSNAGGKTAVLHVSLQAAPTLFGKFVGVVAIGPSFELLPFKVF